MSGRDRAGATLLKRLQAEWQLDEISPVDAGMSDAAVFRVGSDRFLKLADDEISAAALRQEIARTQWLAGQGVRVPATLRVHDEGAGVAWLSTALPGTAATRSVLPPVALVPMLGRALRALHALPVETCAFDESIRMRLAIARRDIDDGRVDPDQFDDRNKGVSPDDIWLRLARNAPGEDWVVAHGDATLSNMIVGPDGAVGFVDCGGPDAPTAISIWRWRRVTSPNNSATNGPCRLPRLMASPHGNTTRRCIFWICMSCFEHETRRPRPGVLYRPEIVNASPPGSP